MAKVMVFGSFDILHKGHLHFLTEAKSYGDCLIVVVAKDGTIMEVKGNPPKYNEHERLEHIRELSFVDRAVMGNEGDKYEIIQEFNPDFICLGYDQNSFTDNLKEELKKRGINAVVLRLRSYMEHIYKSSKLR